MLAVGLLLAADRPALAVLVALLAAAVVVGAGWERLSRWQPLAPAALLLVLFLLPQAVLVAARPPAAPVQDGLLVTEAAARRLLAGLDPYGHDYLDDASLRAFYLPEMAVNPLLGHFVYPPGLLLLALPFAAANLSFAWFWLPALPLFAWSAWLAAGRAGLVAAALSPLLLLDYLYLFNDLLFLGAGLASAGLLLRRRALAAGALLGLSLALKQTAVVLVPPLTLLAWLLLDAGGRVRWAAGAALVVALLCAPFVAWDPRSFAADTASYFYGSGLDSFPIRGFGVPGLLLDSGLLASRWAPYPAALVQVVVLVPLLALAARRLRRRFSWTEFWLWAGLEALAVFLFGRTLAPNYVTVAATLLGLALGSELESRAPASAGAADEHPGPGDAGE